MAEKITLPNGKVVELSSIQVESGTLTAKVVDEDGPYQVGDIVYNVKYKGIYKYISEVMSNSSYAFFVVEFTFHQNGVVVRSDYIYKDEVKYLKKVDESEEKKVKDFLKKSGYEVDGHYLFRTYTIKSKEGELYYYLDDKLEIRRKKCVLDDEDRARFAVYNYFINHKDAVRVRELMKTRLRCTI